MTSACGVVEAGARPKEHRMSTRAVWTELLVLPYQEPEGNYGRSLWKMTRQINRAYVEEVEKALSIEGRHTYLYAPADGEAIETVVKHLHRAGLVVLLLVNEKQDKTLTGTYDLVFEGDANEEEVSRQIRSASAYEGTIVAGRDYI